MGILHSRHQSQKIGFRWAISKHTGISGYMIWSMLFWTLSKNTLHRSSWELKYIEGAMGRGVVYSMLLLRFRLQKSRTFHISCISLVSHGDNVSLQQQGHLSLWGRVSLLTDGMILLAIPRLCPDLCQRGWYQTARSGYGFRERIYLKVPCGVVDHHGAMFLWAASHFVFSSRSWIRIRACRQKHTSPAFRFKLFHCSKIVMQRHIATRPLRIWRKHSQLFNMV